MEKKSPLYLDAAGKRAENKFGNHALDFNACDPGREALSGCGNQDSCEAEESSASLGALEPALRSAERALLVPEGLPHRPWFRHAIYAPGEYTGYAAVVIPGSK